jgi:NAD(P)-dependent dehydrogenase (short-subunit alcohol dehydrogenase family)
MPTMQLAGKNAVVYGAAGSIGGPVARAFAEAGARVFLTGRTLETLEAVATDSRRAGGAAEVAVLDAHDQAAVDDHAAQLVADAGRLDISFNAVGINVVQGRPLVEMSLDDFLMPVIESARTQFVTATAAARHMTASGSGVIVLLTATASMESRHEMGGFSLACAGIEALTRGLAGEVGRLGVRVVAIRANFTPETLPGVTDDDVAQNVRDTLLGRLPRLAELAGTAVFLASDAAGAMTGAIANLSCGAIVD